MLRTSARFAQAAETKAGAPGLEYTACRVFAGEYPTHYIPAKDSLADKNGGMWTSQPFQINYGPNQGRFDYGTVEHPYQRSFVAILKQETHWSTRQLRYMAYMGLWMTPAIFAYEEWYRREAEGKLRN